MDETSYGILTLTHCVDKAMLIQVKKVQQGDKIQPYMLYVNYADYFLLMDRMRD